MKIGITLLSSIFLFQGCISAGEKLSRNEAISIAASQEKIKIDDYEIITNQDSKGWVIIFHGKSGTIGDEYAFFVDDNKRVRRVK